jgi:1-acyl-sn-glycerol-3-phosphate acyltransferase
MDRILGLAPWLGSGVLVGSVLAALQRHPGRSLGLIPWGTTGLALILALAAALGGTPDWLYLVAGVMAGAFVWPLLISSWRPSQEAGRAWGIRGLAVGLVLLFATGLVVADMGLLPNEGQLWLNAGCAALVAGAAWILLYREGLEQLMEVLIWPIYRISGRGPGFEQLPRCGPVIVLANHAAWFDPLWLGKVVPRRLVPMMTSGFYDLPGLRWLMRNVVGAIRVSNAPLRREVPELDLAIKALDAGGCLVIFPEGRMRRSEEKLLHPFGQGIWRILKERPQTPVVACWIEGGWGSFFSYFRGKPTKNKRFDFWRAIRIGAGIPAVLEEELVQDRQATRRYLMQRCLEARQHLGLEPVSVEKVAEIATMAGEFEEAG